MKELKGTKGLLELDYEEFALKYITQNRRGYNSTAIKYEDNVLKMSAPQYVSGTHKTLYISLYGNDVENIIHSLLDLQEQMLIEQEFILQEVHLEKVKDYLTVEKVFKEEIK